MKRIYPTPPKARPPKQLLLLPKQNNQKQFDNGAALPSFGRGDPNCQNQANLLP